MRKVSTVLGAAARSCLLSSPRYEVAACANETVLSQTGQSPGQYVLLPQFTQLPHSFHSSSSSSKGSRQGQKNQQQHRSQSQQQQQQQHQQQQQRRGPAAAGDARWPQPSRLVIPSRKAVAPVLGRVPPSSRAAEAATASMIQGAAAAAAAATAAKGAAAPAASDQQPVIHVTGKFVTEDAAAAVAAADRHPSSSSSSTQDRPTAYPWDVVSHLTQSSPYTLTRMADMNIQTYLKYLRDARLGMPSIFDLGVARSQGRMGRFQLLRRELLLQHYIQQVTQQPTAAAAAAAAETDCKLDRDHDHDLISGSTSSSDEDQLPTATAAQRSLTDEALLEASKEVLAAAAAAAAASSMFCAEATADEVGEALMDYFVMKQCMRVLLLQRQHRQMMHLKYLQHLEQQQQQQGGSSSSAAAATELFGKEDLEDVDVFDAFFDADLDDYQEYLEAAAAGQPSVFTTVNPFADKPPQQQQQQQRGRSRRRPTSGSSSSRDQDQQQQQQQQLAEARQELAAAAAMLSLLPRGIKSRPLIRVTGSQILRLSLDSGIALESVVEIFEGFYRLKRLGFRRVLEELIAAANDDAPLQRF